MRKDSDVFFKQFAGFCRLRRDANQWEEFHSEMGDMFRPYGDLLNEANKMLHKDYQYDISSESLTTTLRSSDIGSDSNIPSIVTTSANHATAKGVRGAGKANKQLL